MKRIFTYILVMSIAMIAAVSCSSEALEKDATAKGDFAAFTLRLCNIDPAQTKALTGNQIAGEDAYNENTITHIDYFFFGDEAGTTLLYKGRLSVSDLTEVEGQDYTYEKEFNVTSTYPNLKYGCYVYVVANYPSTITATTLQALMALPLTADWTASQTSFVMDTYDADAGSALHTLSPVKTGEVRTVTLPLTRIAAKIQVNLKVKKLFTDGDGQDWTPVVDHLTHQVIRLRKTATLEGSPAEYESNADYVNTASVQNFTADGNENTDYYSYALAPYYSYPQTFDTSTNTSPYIKFQLPWVNEDKGYNNFYYKFLIPELTTFERNRIYIFDATIDVIGGTEEDFAEVIDYIYVADWWTPGNISATYESAKYLSVISHSYTIYGEPGITVPVVSSDDIQITNAEATGEYIGKIKGSKTNLKNGTTTYVYADVDTNGKESFTLTHALVDNVALPDFDCTPITYTVTIKHVSGGLSKTETVTIVQYPNIYVERMQSNGYVWVNGQGGGDSQIYVYNNNRDVIGVVTGRAGVNGQGDNNNQNNYNIYVSVLPAGSSYIIGDPRVGGTAISNLGYATYSSQNNYTLDNTVPTKYQSAGQATENVIAPAFKVASSYGKTTRMSYTRARERCASYQEAGFPAGRWRLPTEAEVRFAVDLSKNGHIPTLFQTEENNGYWTANGSIYSTTANGTLYTTTNPTSDNTDRSVRCVYDIWYWGDAPMTNNSGTATAVTDANGNVTGYTGAATQWIGYKMD
ncbi:MAG: hypothetical protein IKX67_09270 [Bacteroidales bacterium]|nr:hypothetical protein [Bacteroidales bacterium]